MIYTIQPGLTDALPQREHRSDISFREQVREIRDAIGTSHCVRREFIEAHRDIFGHLPMFLSGDREEDNMARLYAQCLFMDVSPRSFIRANMEQLRPWLTKRGLRFRLPMLLGPEAKARYATEREYALQRRSAPGYVRLDSPIGIFRTECIATEAAVGAAFLHLRVRDQRPEPIDQWKGATNLVSTREGLRPYWPPFDAFAREGRLAPLLPCSGRRLHEEADLIRLEAACSALGQFGGRLSERLGTPAFTWTDLADAVRTLGTNPTPATRRTGPWLRNV